MGWRIDPWRIVKTAYGKEQPVAQALTAMGFETFLPVEVRIYRRLRGRQREPLVVALRPGWVFARIELSDMDRVGALDHVMGFVKDADGFRAAVPDWQMDEFRIAYDCWIAEIRELAALGKALARRPEKPKVYALKDGLQLLLAQMESGCS